MDRVSFAGCILVCASTITLRSLIFRARCLPEKVAGRRALVTGSASGVGKEVTLILASRGWRVWACDVNVKGLEVYDSFPNVNAVVFDVTDPAACERLAEDIGKDGGSLDALVNVAGIIKPGPAIGSSDVDSKVVFEVNALAPIRLARLMIPLMLRKATGGVIVNLTSSGAFLGWPFSGAYSATKSALSLFSDCLRRETLANNLPIRVRVVEPGPIDTPLAQSVPQLLKQFATQNPSNPFTPACEKVADFQLKLMKLGYGVDAVALSARDVADIVVLAVECEEFPSHYFAAARGFKFLA